MVGAGAGAGAGRWMLSRASLGLTDVFGMPPPLQERKQMIMIIVESSKKKRRSSFGPSIWTAPSASPCERRRGGKGGSTAGALAQ